MNILKFFRPILVSYRENVFCIFIGKPSPFQLAVEQNMQEMQNATLEPIVTFALLGKGAEPSERQEGR